MARRPKYAPRRDGNDDIVRVAIAQMGNKIGEFHIEYRDMSKMGKAIDYLVFIGPMTVGMEVKQPGAEARLTKGEREWPGVKFVVTNHTDVKRAIVLSSKLAASVWYALDDIRRQQEEAAKAPVTETEKTDSINEPS